ncbi:MAG: hypothetical protein LC663_04605, partial [Actinobacteria bacterium]|nr:hypothetical protein [Actinomycetota bacterium]
MIVDLFDGRAFVGVHDISLDGAVIASVVPASGTPVGVLLPGFIDAHVHLGFCSPASVLAAGVTTARDLGWPLARSLDGGPDVVRAGQILTPAGGYPSRAAWAPTGTAREIASVDEIAPAVAEQPGEWIKIAQDARGPVFDATLLSSLCSAARAAGKRVTSHCTSLAQLVAGLDAGVTEFAHGLWSDQPIPSPVVERLVARGVVIVPTLHIDPYPTRLDNVGRFFRAGGTVVYGTDMG